MKITKFEEITAWKEARVLVQMIYAFTLTGPFVKDFGLKEQIQRAAVSSMSNIAEGFESGSSAQFVRFLIYARSSISEVQSLLYAAHDQNYIGGKEFRGAYAQAQKTGKLINGFISYLRQTKSSNR